MNSLTNGQKTAIKLAEEGGHLFITGPGGTGKSYLIDILRARLEGCAVTATTAVAACNVQGSTIHSFSGLGMGTKPAPGCVQSMSSDRRSVIATTSTLILDEISMLHPDHLDIIDEIFQLIRGSGEPFGGIQMIFVGDFFQLPPVPNKLAEDRKRRSETCYAFESKAWKDAAPTMVELTENLRQSEDVEWMEELGKIRIGEDIDREFLSEAVRERGEAPPETHAILYSHNKTVDEYNADRLDSLPGEVHSFKSEDKGSPRFLNGCTLPSTLTLKIGAKCVVLKNIPPLHNGSIVTVESYDDTTGLPIITDLASGDCFILPRTSQDLYNGVERQPVTFYDDAWRTTEGTPVPEEFVKGKFAILPKIVASRKALPLRLCWATTIHKSQGQTLSLVAADLSKCFAPGHAYTALSRVQTFKGLSLSSNSKRIKFNVHKKVKEFYQLD